MVGVLATEVVPDAPLMAAGIDSLGATELQQALCEELGTELPSTLLFDHPSLTAILGHLQEFCSKATV